MMVHSAASLSVCVGGLSEKHFSDQPVIGIGSLRQ